MFKVGVVTLHMQFLHPGDRWNLLKNYCLVVLEAATEGQDLLHKTPIAAFGEFWAEIYVRSATC